jgi:hypothetical protein
VVITRREPVGGQQWTDGFECYSDNGRYYQSGREDGQDLVSFVGLLPDNSQRAPVSRPAETESTTAVAGSMSDDPGRIIYDLGEKLKAANAEIDRLRIELQETYAGWSDSNSALADQTAETDRLKAERQTEFTAAQQLRSENESLTVRLQRAEMVAAEALQKWETTEQVCLRIITALAGVRS